MNTSTMKRLQTRYTVASILTAICISACTISSYLLTHHGVAGHYMIALAIAGIGGFGGWTGTVVLLTRWKDIKQLRMLDLDGPYSRNEFVSPRDAGSQIGKGKNNLWRFLND